MTTRWFKINNRFSVLILATAFTVLPDISQEIGIKLLKIQVHSWLKMHTWRKCSWVSDSLSSQILEFFVVNPDCEVEVFIILASVSLFLALWTLHYYLAYLSSAGNRESRRFLVVKDSFHNGRCFSSRTALPNLTQGSYLSFLFWAASRAH